jgi:hypothetical protein
MSTRENISRGTLANDGTGDQPRSAANKMNNNFIKIFKHLGGDSNQLSRHISIDSDKLVFEGNLIDSNQTNVSAENPTATRNVIIPNASGTLVLTAGAQTITDKTFTSPVLTTPQVNDSDGTYQYIFTPAGGLSADRVLFIPVLSDSDTLVVAKTSQTLTNKTLTEPNITSPDITTGINDANGASMIDFTPIASSALNFSMTNAAAAGTPILAVTGSDSDIDMSINGKNGGAVKVSKGAYQVATMTSAGAISKNRSMIDFNSGVALAATLADGQTNGEFKKLVNRGAGTVTVTPANFAQGTSFQLAQNEACEVIWNGSNWFIISNQSVLTIS